MADWKKEKGKVGQGESGTDVGVPVLTTQLERYGSWLKWLLAK